MAVRLFYGAMRATVVTALLLSALSASAQPLEDPNLVNQRTQETLDAARAASPHTAESASAYYADDAEAVPACVIERVWDPTRERSEPPRMPWGDPDLRGYWLNASYTPRQRPVELADKALYSVEETIQVFQSAVARDASYDPATVHYDWREFGMDNW